MCFSANLGRHFMTSNSFGRHFYPDFQQIKTYGDALAPTTHPPPGTTVFHNSIKGKCVIYQDRFEKEILQLFGHPENSEGFSIISVSIFEVSIVDEQKQT